MRVAMLGSSYYRSSLMPYARRGDLLGVPWADPDKYAAELAQAPAGSPDNWAAKDWTDFGLQIAKMGTDVAKALIQAKAGVTTDPNALARLNSMTPGGGMDSGTIIMIGGVALMVLVLGGVILTRRPRRR